MHSSERHSVNASKYSCQLIDRYKAVKTIRTSTNFRPFRIQYELITAYIHKFDNILFDSSYEKTMVSNDQ